MYVSRLLMISFSSFSRETSSDKPLPDLLEQSTNSAPLTTQLKRNSRARQLRRPRSCIDPSGDGDPSSSLRKRWSGVQLGSMLSQALDRLLAEDAEEVSAAMFCRGSGLL